MKFIPITIPFRKRIGKVKRLLLLLALGFSQLATAETVYVTDKLLLGVYPNADGSGEQIKVLPSGTKLEVLERQGRYFARILAEDGTEGWVKSSFLVSEVPALIRIRDFEAQVENFEKLQSELSALKQQNIQLTEKVSALDKQLADKNADLKKLTAAPVPQTPKEILEAETVAKAEIKVAAAELHEKPNTIQASFLQPFKAHLVLFAVVASLSLLLGVYFGRKALEWHIRRKYSGYRVW